MRTDELIQIHQQYERIPAFSCIPGCTDCCGPVPFTEAEWNQLAEHPPLTTHTCQFKGETGCTIYDRRPLLCRLFGAVDTTRLRCPHGKRPDTFLTDRQGGTIARRYFKHELGHDPLRDMTWARGLLGQADRKGLTT